MADSDHKNEQNATVAGATDENAAESLENAELSDIDRLLDDVTDSLAQLESGGTEENQPPEAAKTSESEMSNQSDPESTPENSPAKVTLDADDSEKMVVAENTEPSTDIEDDLAALIDELEESQKTEATPADQTEINEVPEAAVEAEAEEPEVEDIDDTLAKLADEIDHTNNIEQESLAQAPGTNEAVTENMESDTVADQEIDDLLDQVSDQLNEINDDVSSVAKESLEITDEQDDSDTAADDADATTTPADPPETELEETVSADVVDDEGVDETPEEIEKPSSPPANKPVDDFDAALNNYNQKKVEELSTVAKTVETPSRITDGPYGHFPIHQRMLIQSLDTINKPFGFVGDNVKEMIGFAAVITWLVIMVVAALILYLI